MTINDNIYLVQVKQRNKHPHTPILVLALITNLCKQHGNTFPYKTRTSGD